MEYFVAVVDRFVKSPPQTRAMGPNERVDRAWIERVKASNKAFKIGPGPLFAFAAYLGAAMHGPVSGIGGAALALLAFLLLAVWKTPPWLVVVLSALAAQLQHFIK
jgi:hypothetical protein